MLIAAVIVMMLSLRPIEDAGPVLVAQTGHFGSSIQGLHASPSRRVATVDAVGVTCVWDGLGRQLARIELQADPASGLDASATPEGKEALVPERRPLCVALDDSGRYLAATEWCPVAIEAETANGSAPKSTLIPALAVTLYDVFSSTGRPSAVCRFTGWTGSAFVGLEVIGKPAENGDKPWRTLSIIAQPPPSPDSMRRGGLLNLRCSAAIQAEGTLGTYPATVKLGSLQQGDAKASLDFYGAASCRAPGGGPLLWLNMPKVFGGRGTDMAVWTMQGGQSVPLVKLQRPKAITFGADDRIRIAASRNGARLLLYTKTFYAVYDLTVENSKPVLEAARGTGGQTAGSPQWGLTGGLEIKAAALSPTGQAIAFARDLGGNATSATIEMMDVATGTVRTIPTEGANAQLLAWQDFGAYSDLAAGLNGPVLVHWLLDSRDQASPPKTIAPETSRLSTAVVSPDAGVLAIGSEDAPLRCFDLRLGRPAAIAPSWLNVRGGDGDLRVATLAQRIAFSADGVSMVFGERIYPGAAISLSNGAELARPPRQGVLPVGFLGPDPVWVGSGGGSTVDLYVGKKGGGARKLTSLPRGTGLTTMESRGIAFADSDEERGVVDFKVVDASGAVRTTSSANLRSLGTSVRLVSASLSSSGETALLALDDGPRHGFAVYKTATGSHLAGKWFSASDSSMSGSIATDDSNALLAFDGQVEVVDVSDGTSRRFQGPSGGIVALQVVRIDHRMLVMVATITGLVAFYGLADLEMVATIVVMKNGDWAVTDRRQNFDAANVGDVSGLHWIKDGRAARLAELAGDHYRPALLAELLTGTPRSEDEASAPHTKSMRFGPSAEEVVDVEDRPPFGVRCEVLGGVLRAFVGDPGPTPSSAWLVVNGVRRKLLSAEEIASIQAGTFELSMADPLIAGVQGSGEAPRVEIVTMTDSGIANSGSAAEQRPRGAPSDPTLPPPQAARPAIYGLLVGCNNYKTQRLQGAVADARAMERMLRSLEPGRGKVLCEVSEADQIVDAGTISKSLDELLGWMRSDASLSADDIVFLFLAGHGKFESGYRYLVPGSDKELGWGTIEAFLEAVCRLPKVPRVALVLDTCAAGAAVDQLTEGLRAQGPLHRAAKSLGVSLLAATRDAAGLANEWEAIRHGALTFCMIDDVQYDAVADLAKDQEETTVSVDISDCFTIQEGGSGNYFNRAVRRFGVTPAAIRNESRALLLGAAKRTSIAELFEPEVPKPLFLAVNLAAGASAKDGFDSNLSALLAQRANRVDPVSRTAFTWSEALPTRPPREGLFLIVDTLGEGNDQRIVGLTLRRVAPGRNEKLESDTAVRAIDDSTLDSIWTWLTAAMQRANGPKPP